MLLVGEAVLARLTVPDDGYVAPPSSPRTLGDASAKPLTYVVLGDSTGAGRGARYDEGIAVRSAQALADGGRRVRLVNLAVSGATFADVRELQLDAAVRARPDLVLISCGANDVTGLRSTGSVRRDLSAVVARLREVVPSVAIVVTASPDIGGAPRLAQPLRALAGWRKGHINRAIDDVVAASGLTRAEIAERTGPAFRRDRSLFAADGYHPSAAGYALWLPVLAEAFANALKEQSARVAAPGTQNA